MAAQGGSEPCSQNPPVQQERRTYKTSRSAMVSVSAQIVLNALDRFEDRSHPLCPSHIWISPVAIPPASSEVPVSTATRQPLHRFLDEVGGHCYWWTNKTDQSPRCCRGASGSGTLAPPIVLYKRGLPSLHDCLREGTP